MKKIKSLRIKAVLVVMLVAAILASTAILISYTVYSNEMDTHYKSNAMNIAKTAASMMDAEKISTYLTTMQKDAEYDSMLNTLFRIKNNNDVLYMYVQTVTANGCTYIMDADDAATACPLGQTDPLAPQNFQYLDKLNQGIPAFITKSEYGWLCSAGAPIINKAGDVVALAFVDISMDEVMADRQNFLILVCIVLIAATAAIIAFMILVINRAVVSPINALSRAAGRFVHDKGRDGAQHGGSEISNLSIRTGDEIENLCISIQTMEKDINTYIENLTLVTAEKERMGAELQVAAHIQSSMLPCIFPPFPEHKEFDIYAIMNPAKEVGGDFYDIFMTDDDHLVVVVADVSGKGIPAALFMVITKTLIKNKMQEGLSPAEVFTSVNAQLCENNDAGMFVTAWMGILEISTGKFIFVNAGHNLPMLKKDGGEFEPVKSRAGFVLAGMEGIQYKQNELQLEKK
ncbi:MAG: SpoIIE family protein phosphatase [Eubacteriales bacterium]